MNLKRLSIIIAWVLISTLLFEVSAWAAQIKLKDGTLIVGEIQQDKLKLRTSYGEMEINVKDIASIVDEKITLRDGSILKGDIIDPQLIVMSKYGELKIDTKDIASITFVEEGVKIEKKAPAVTAEKPLTSKELMKITDMEKAEATAEGLKLLAIGLAVSGGIAVVGFALAPNVPFFSGGMLITALLFGGGAWWSWDQSKKNEKKARKLRQELEGRAFLNLQNEDNRLSLRIGTPSFKVNSETGQLQWNLISYKF